MRDVLVLVTERSAYQQLIWAGGAVAAASGLPLKVVSVRPRRALREDAGLQLERLFALARGAGAEITVYYNDDTAGAAIRHMKHHKVARVIAGAPTTAGEGAYIERVRQACPDVPISFVGESGVSGGYPAMTLAKTAVAY